MKLVVRGDTEYGDSSTQAIEVKPKYFNPKYLEVYMGDEGEEMLVKTYKVLEPLTDTPEQPESGYMKITKKDIEGNFYYTVDKNNIYQEEEQPTQEIEPLSDSDFSGFSVWHGEERRFVTTDKTSEMMWKKINELVTAVNELKKGNE